MFVAVSCYEGMSSVLCCLACFPQIPLPSGSCRAPSLTHPRPSSDTFLEDAEDAESVSGPETVQQHEMPAI